MPKIEFNPLIALDNIYYAIDEFEEIASPFHPGEIKKINKIRSILDTMLEEYE